MTPNTSPDNHAPSIEDAAQALAEFRRLRAGGTLGAGIAGDLSLRAATMVIDHYNCTGDYLRDAVTLICEIAASEDPQVARAGVTALFPALVERLNDSFDPAACKLYDRIFTQVIDFHRRAPGGEELDRRLREFGLLNEADLLARKSRIASHSLSLHLISNISYQISHISRVLLLSRVTIGADVAITSVIIARLREVLPEAEFVILGSAKLRELYGGDPQVRVREIKYERGGSVMSRLLSWIDVAEAVEDEANGPGAGEFLLIDPDSRLTQLGLLPLLKDERKCFHFESRSYRHEAATSIGRLTACWINEITGTDIETFPFVALPQEHREFGRSLCDKLRRTRSSHIVAISLGVGGNPGKRLSDEFESELIDRLIAGSTLILDKGATADERGQIDRIVATLRSKGRSVVEIDERNRAEVISMKEIEADTVTWDGGIGAFAGLIAASDRYVGYDSAFQHIAAALRVPTLTIFVSSNPETFAERWRPHGPGVIEVLTVNDPKTMDLLRQIQQMR